MPYGMEVMTIDSELVDETTRVLSDVLLSIGELITVEEVCPGS